MFIPFRSWWVCQEALPVGSDNSPLFFFFPFLDAIRGIPKISPSTGVWVPPQSGPGVDLKGSELKRGAIFGFLSTLRLFKSALHLAPRGPSARTLAHIPSAESHRCVQPRRRIGNVAASLRTAESRTWTWNPNCSSLYGTPSRRWTSRSVEKCPSRSWR